MDEKTAGLPAPRAGQRAPSVTRLGPAEAGRCRRRVHLDHDRGRDRSERMAPDSSAVLRIADLDLHRTGSIDRFPQAVAGWTQSSDERPDLILGPVLRSDRRVGSPDLLMALDGGYVPILVRGHRTLDAGSGALVSTVDAPRDRSVSSTVKPRQHPADAGALAHFHRLLGDLGLASATAVGGVIGRGNPQDLILWHRMDGPDSTVLTDYDARFEDRYAVAKAAAGDGPALAGPSQVGECRRCPWWTVCSAELVAARDVSLVAPGADGFLLKDLGLRTVDDLADADPAALAALPLTGVATGQGIVRARAWQRGAALVRTHDLPRVHRADIELDVDMESFLEDGAYLWGTMLSGTADGLAAAAVAGFVPEYRGFVTWETLPTADEGRAFAEFWAYLRQLRTVAGLAGLTFAAYCYSRQAEERWLRSTPARYPEVPGMPSASEITAFITSADWVDLFAVIGEEFVVPGSRRLKKVATVAGFAWRDPEPGGANSMVWYREAVASPPDLTQRERVLRYNEDDVLATRELRRWISDRAALETPSVAELLAVPPTHD